jgi:hypothetical protein
VGAACARRAWISYGSARASSSMSRTEPVRGVHDHRRTDRQELGPTGGWGSLSAPGADRPCTRPRGSHRRWRSMEVSVRWPMELTMHVPRAWAAFLLFGCLTGAVACAMKVRHRAWEPCAGARCVELRLAACATEAHPLAGRCKLASRVCVGLPSRACTALHPREGRWRVQRSSMRVDCRYTRDIREGL